MWDVERNYSPGFDSFAAGFVELKRPLSLASDAKCKVIDSNSCGVVWRKRKTQGGDE